MGIRVLLGGSSSVYEGDLTPARRRVEPGSGEGDSQSTSGLLSPKLITMTEEPRTPEPDDTAPTEPLSSGDPLGEGGTDPKSDAPPPSSPGVRRLTRSSSDKLIGGVA